MSSKTSQGFFDGLRLVLAGLESFLTFQFHLDLRTREGYVPVHRGRSNIRNTNTAGFNNLVRQCGLGIRRPLIRRRDDIAVREMFPAVFRHERLTGSLKEGINVAFLNAGGRLIKLRLDGHPTIISYAVGDHINAGIDAPTVIAPIRPAADLIKLLGQRWGGAEEVHHEFFEGNTVLALRLIRT